jgi:hypothetical protein
MARRRFRVVLEVLSNMDGDPPDGEEEKLIKSYLEGVAGIGIIEVREIGPADSPSAPSGVLRATRPTLWTEVAPPTSPKSSNRASGIPLPSWVPDEHLRRPRSAELFLDGQLVELTAFFGV